MQFEGFPKIPRWDKEIIITEKIDGTNAQVYISEPNEFTEGSIAAVEKDGFTYFILAGSRTRWVTPQNDNFGFASWVYNNAEELTQLGPGHHFGEWWGKGIQRGYGIEERRFSLFNTSRWTEERPSCCDVVPTLYKGQWCDLDGIMYDLKSEGSRAALGFMNPEGIIIFHTVSGHMYKKTFEKDDGKWEK